MYIASLIAFGIAAVTLAITIILTTIAYRRQVSLAEKLKSTVYAIPAPPAPPPKAELPLKPRILPPPVVEIPPMAPQPSAPVISFIIGFIVSQVFFDIGLAFYLGFLYGKMS